MLDIKIGIVGCGMVGERYARELRSLGAEVVATADVAGERASRVAGISGATAYVDYHELLEEVDIDLVCVCTPTPFHYGPVVKGARHGRHVFCEKPLSESLSLAQEMCDAVRDADVAMGMGFKMRFEGVFADAMSVIESGDIGKPMYSVFSYFQPVPPGKRIWYCDVGVLREMLSHVIDLSNWMLGLRPRSAAARLDSLLGRKGEDKAFLRVAYDDGAVASIQGGYIGTDYPPVSASDDILFQIVGDAGYVAGSRSGHLITVTRKGLAHQQCKPVNAFRAELEAFLTALSTGEALPVPAQAGLVAQAVIEAALASNRKGRAVDVQV